MKSDSKSIPFALEFSARKPMRSFQKFALIRTTQIQLSSVSWQRIQPAEQALETFRIDTVQGWNVSGEFGTDSISARSFDISACAKELRVRWTTEPTETIEVKNRK